MESLPSRYLKLRGLQRFEPTPSNLYDRGKYFLSAGAFHNAIRDLKEARRLSPTCDVTTGYFPTRALATATIALAEQTFDEAMSDVGAAADRTTRRDLFAFRVNRALGLAHLAAHYLGGVRAPCESPSHANIRTRVRAFQARVRAQFTNIR